MSGTVIEPAKQYRAIIDGQDCLVETVHCMDDGLNWVCCHSKLEADTAITIAASELTLAETILYVEPEDTQRKVGALLLESSGFRVFSVGRAEEAFDIACTEPAIDVLLTSVRLLGTDGPSLSGNVSILHPNVKAFYTSNNTYDELPSEFRDSFPRRKFVPKPFCIESLVDAIRGTLDRAGR